MNGQRQLVHAKVLRIYSSQYLLRYLIYQAILLNPQLTKSAHPIGPPLTHSFNIDRCRRKGINTLFVLTTRTSHWFRERGFNQAELTRLPVKKRELYNYQRKAKVFIKRID